MSSTFMGVALLAKPVELTKDSVSAVVSALPSGCNASLQRVSDDGKKASIFVDGVSCAVSIFNDPMPAMDFQHELKKPDTDELRMAVDRHTAQLVVFCRLEDAEMGQSVVAAAAIHLLTLKLGELGDPVAGHWVASKRLDTWRDFSLNALAAAQVFENETHVDFPSRYWVSVQLDEKDFAFSGQTHGLRAFTGYELSLAPSDLQMEHLAEVLVSTVQYLFDNGSVFSDGHTMSTANGGDFSMSLNSQNGIMSLTRTMNEVSENG